MNTNLTIFKEKHDSCSKMCEFRIILTDFGQNLLKNWQHPHNWGYSDPK